MQTSEFLQAPVIHLSRPRASRASTYSDAQSFRRPLRSSPLAGPRPVTAPSGTRPAGPGSLAPIEDPRRFYNNRRVSSTPSLAALKELESENNPDAPPLPSMSRPSSPTSSINSDSWHSRHSSSSSVPSPPSRRASWLTDTPYDETPRFSRLGMSSTTVTMPLTVKQHRRMSRASLPAASPLHSPISSLSSLSVESIQTTASEDYDRAVPVAITLTIHDDNKSSAFTIPAFPPDKKHRSEKRGSTWSKMFATVGYSRPNSPLQIKTSPKQTHPVVTPTLRTQRSIWRRFLPNKRHGDRKDLYPSEN